MRRGALGCVLPSLERMGIFGWHSIRPSGLRPVLSVALSAPVEPADPIFIQVVARLLASDTRALSAGAAVAEVEVIRLARSQSSRSFKEYRTAKPAFANFGPLLVCIRHFVRVETLSPRWAAASGVSNQSR